MFYKHHSSSNVEVPFFSYFPVPPLFVIEFLHRVVDTFEDYFQGCGESILKENYVIVYEVKIVYGNDP